MPVFVLARHLSSTHLGSDLGHRGGVATGRAAVAVALANPLIAGRALPNLLESGLDLSLLLGSLPLPLQFGLNKERKEQARWHGKQTNKQERKNE